MTDASRSTTTAASALRTVAVGRKAWLFAGSDENGESAGHFLSLIASCKLHGIEPQAYLRDLFRVLATGRARLAPKFWLATRALLNEAELAREIGPLAIPDAPPSE